MKIQRCYVGIMVCILCLLSACGTRAPIITPSEVTTSYLDAMKAQKTDEMRMYTLSGLGENFTMNDEDISSLGLDATATQAFIDYMLKFQYTIESEHIELSEEKATVVILINTYDVGAVIKKSVEDNKTKFLEIGASKESDEHKEKQIAQLIIGEFETAQQDIETSFTIQLKLKDGEWKVKDVDASFYNAILNIEE